MLKIDLHSHSNFSDGYSDPLEVYQSALDKNLDAFSLTDHNTMSGVFTLLESLGGNPSDSKMQFIPGMELSLSIGHFLIWGIDSEKLHKQVIETWNIPEGTTGHHANYGELREYLIWVQEQNGVAIAAHPGIPSGFMSISKDRVLDLYQDGLIQGAEAHNAQLQKTFGTWLYTPWHHSVARFLRKHEIPSFAFSDSHLAARVALRHTQVSGKKRQLKKVDLLDALRRGRVQTEWREELAPTNIYR